MQITQQTDNNNPYKNLAVMNGFGSNVWQADDSKCLTISMQGKKFFCKKTNKRSLRDVPTKHSVFKVVCVCKDAYTTNRRGKKKEIM